MVAPYFEGHLKRSLVRIPNRSSDRSQKAIIADLSRVSGLAAMLNVSRGLPPGCLFNPSVSSQLVSNTGKISTNANASPTTPVATSRPTTLPPQPPNAMTPSSSDQAIRTRPTTLPVEEVTASPVRVTPLIIPTRAPHINISTCRKHPRPDEPHDVVSRDVFPPSKKARVTPETSTEEVQHAGMLQSPTGTTGIRMIPVYAVPLTQYVSSHLLQERNRLKQENLVLKRRLIQIQQLFRNKQQLTTVVRNLGIQVQE
ncbi:hypothetical protein OTU49_000149 [Cherax quadricarinatus]|uniref:Uncharacterized protein n=1 Tax=Cherax quadricarinatus TaxID=27406 RepID=A0AAW0Y5F8_CHEQU|nr:uncharacterized protein LOC128688282 [Cherax quadricarinatus]XP_053631997.1 uncharacterized protein LOC128688282 [Cherax quadricarinatus]